MNDVKAVGKSSNDVVYEKIFQRMRPYLTESMLHRLALGILVKQIRPEGNGEPNGKSSSKGHGND